MKIHEIIFEKPCLVCNVWPLFTFFSLQETGEVHGSLEHYGVYDHRAIRYCNLCMTAQIEFYSHDCVDLESWDFVAWFVIGHVDLMMLAEFVTHCPNRNSQNCECLIHLHLQESFEKILRNPHTYRTLESKITYNRISVDREKGYPYFRLYDKPYVMYSDILEPNKVWEPD